MFRHIQLTRVVSVLFLLSACNGDDVQLPSDGDAATVTILSGGGQSGEVGSVLSDSISVRVTDSEGRPVPNQLAAFVPVTPGVVLVPDTGTTNGNGETWAQWQLATKAGINRVEVRLVGAGMGSIKTRVSATAYPGPPDILGLVTGMDQAGRIGATLPESLVVQLVDQYGNSIAGELIDWSAKDGAVTSGTVATDSAGRAAVAWRLGLKLGDQQAEARYSGVQGSPATFTAYAYVGP